MPAPHAAYDRVKRAADVIGALVLLVLLSPILLVVWAAILLSMGSPALFRQPRPGKNGRIFTLYKFRTMRPATEAASAVEACATDAERLTRLGRLLRTTSIDEWPQLYNVLRGDMSFVGPRPLLVEYLDHYSPTQARRHEVRPGITGLAQVSGRNALPWDERFALDVRYVDERSLGLDVSILLRTITSAFKREGITEEGVATMTPFVEVKGSSADNCDDMGTSGARVTSVTADTTVPQQPSPKNTEHA